MLASGMGSGALSAGQDRAHPHACKSDVRLHIHAVGAVVGTGDVAQVGLIEVGDVTPEMGFDVFACGTISAVEP